MLKAVVGDITKVQDVDVLVNAANGIGVMGAGVAGAISRSGGEKWSNQVRDYARDNGPFEEGSCYSDNDAGLLKRRGIKKVYHAVTMKYPGGLTSIEIVLEAVRSTISKAQKEGHTSIVFPGLGTGIGGLDKTQVAQRMATELLPYQKRMNIAIVDMSQEFVSAFNKSIGQESEGSRNETGDPPK